MQSYCLKKLLDKTRDIIGINGVLISDTLCGLFDLYR